MNPSPWNIKHGLTTDAIKSSETARKGGTSPEVSVLDYTEPATKPGLSIVCTPGNDVEVTTGKAASRATLILFNRHRYGTNNFRRKNHSANGEETLEFCIEVASGEIIAKAGQLEQDDFISWKEVSHFNPFKKNNWNLSALRDLRRDLLSNLIEFGYINYEPAINGATNSKEV